MRNIWIRRNDYIFNKKFISPYILLQKTKKKLKYFPTTNAHSQQNTTIRHIDNISWTTNLILKANWDVIVNKKNKIMGIGKWLLVIVLGKFQHAFQLIKKLQLTTHYCQLGFMDNFRILCRTGPSKCPPGRRCTDGD